MVLEQQFRVRILMGAISWTTPTRNHLYFGALRHIW